MNDDPVRTKGKFQVLFEKGKKGSPDFGSLAGVQAGDFISWIENGTQMAEVDKVVGTKWSRRFKTKAMTYRQWTVKKSLTVDIKDITEALRLLPGEEPPKRFEDMFMTVSVQTTR